MNLQEPVYWTNDHPCEWWQITYEGD